MSQQAPESEITNRYSFRGLLAALDPEIYFKPRPNSDRHVLTVFLTVPHRSTGRRFPVADTYTWRGEPPDQADVDLRVAQVIKQILEHEVREGLGVDGVYADPHLEDSISSRAR